MTFKEWQEFARNLKERSYRLSKVYTERARDIGEKELGSGRDLCFLCAHNWQGQSWMTPAQNKAARTILWLQKKSWEPGTLADRIIDRAWKQMQKGLDN